MDEKGKLIEAALFMTPQAVNVSDIMGIISEANYTMAKGIALCFMKEFNQRDSSLQIVQIEDGFQMVIRPAYEEKVRHLAKKAMFHPGLMKTLALIALAYDHIHRLLEEGLVAREPKGRSYTLRTTKKFLEYFGKDAIKQKKLAMPRELPSSTE